MAALTFGNVHGVYKPGNVKLRPELLKEIQDGLAKRYGTGPKPLDLVFHGGSGRRTRRSPRRSPTASIKMNIDTDTQYAFTRSVAGYMFKNYDGVLKVDGEVGNKKVYDPRAWGKVAEAAMAKRVVQTTQQLGSAGARSADRGDPGSLSLLRRSLSPSKVPRPLRDTRWRSAPQGTCNARPSCLNPARSLEPARRDRAQHPRCRLEPVERLRSRCRVTR